MASERHIKAGMYDILNTMEEKALEKALQKNEQREQERLEQALSRKVIRLKKQRDLYKQRLAQDDASGGSLSSKVVMKLKETQWIYRLLGVSVVTSDADTFLVTFTTSYRGVFHESYTAELKRRSEDKYVLGKHDFPKFICSEDLCSWLESGNETFFSNVHHRLRAFISRREELKAVQASCKDQLSDFITVYDLSFIIFVITFSSNGDSPDRIRMEVSLSYTDPLAVLPSSVQLLPSDSSSSIFDDRVLKNWTHVLTTCRLTEAMPQVLSNPLPLSLLPDGNRQS